VVFDAPLDRDEVPVATRWHPLRTRGESFGQIDRLALASINQASNAWKSFEEKKKGNAWKVDANSNRFCSHLPG